MKLIDHLVKEENTQTEKFVVVGGIEYRGWVIAKPLNVYYEGFWTRLKDAIKVLRGKAFGVQYFEDLTDNEQGEYVKKEMMNQK